MNNRQLFLAGTIAGLAAVMAFAALFSALGSSASAQMQHQGMDMGAMGSGMMATGSTTQYGGMFSSSGSSVVSNVRVTGVSITGDSQVSVSLRYTGTGSAPGVVIVANTDPAAMMSLMHGSTASGGMMGHGSAMGGMGMMGGMSATSMSSYPAWSNAQWQAWHTQMAQQLATTNSTQWQAWHTQMMANPVWTNSTSIPYATMQVGSTAVDAGWKNGSFKVKLEGAGSAYDSAQIMVAVFPLTS
ncbi:hypothetical protein [Nitrososphaera sp.]|uniref:hypothetical protein n=1 Tax=Nitrososphaera sp. TaxID=1971748 RepID=UPI003179F9B5